MKKTGIFPHCCYYFGQNIPYNSDSPAPVGSYNISYF